MKSPPISGLKGTYRRSGQVAERRVGGSTYLIDCDSNAIHRLDPIGAAVWAELAEPKSGEELVATLHAAFHKTERKIIEQDVTDLMDELLEAGLIAAAE